MEKKIRKEEPDNESFEAFGRRVVRVGKAVPADMCINLIELMARRAKDLEYILHA